MKRIALLSLGCLLVLPIVVNAQDKEEDRVKESGQVLRDILESPDKLRRIVRHFTDLSSGNSVAPICNAPWKSAVVELDGSVRPCFFQPVIGKIDGATPLEHALNGDDAIAFRSTLDIDSNATCKRCVCSLNYR